MKLTDWFVGQRDARQGNYNPPKAEAAKAAYDAGYELIAAKIYEVAFA